MLYSDEFVQDTEFQKLLSRREDVDLTTVALELARDAYPGLNFQETLRWIDDRASELVTPLARAATEIDALREIGRCISEMHGINGDVGSYDQVDSSFLHRVIANKRGIPLSLSVLYMAVANRAGFALRGVATPRHFLTRYDSADGPLYLDAFSGGRIMTYHDCLKRVHSATKIPQEQLQVSLKAVGVRPIVIRMLNNLKALYAHQTRWPAALVVQKRLVALSPTDYGERRDLAFVTLKTNRPGHALDLLEDCLKRCPDDENETLKQQVGEAKRQLALAN
ncbi:MAG: tetratricopeptide repeat protein [Planctomycetales bacterium]|nr:tetratricopeptide repeat protein [Planctomycetales bacterium]